MKSLTAKFIVYLAVTLMVVIGTINYWLYEDTKAHLHQSMDQSGQAKLRSIAALSGYYLSHYENEMLRELGRELSREPDVAYVSFRDSSGDNDYAFGQNQSTLSNTYHQDIVVDKATLGRVTLVMDAQRLHEDVNSAMRRSILMSLVSAVLLGSMLYLFFRREIVQEMERSRREGEQFREESNFISAVINTSNSYVLVIDPVGNILLANDPCVQLVADVRGATKPVWSYFDITCADRNLRDILNTTNESSRLTNISQLCRECSVCTIRRPADKDLITEWRFSQLCDASGQVKYLIGTGIDVTEQHMRQEKLSFQAEHDALTALPNRAMLQRKVDEAIERYQTLSEPFTLLYLDLDRFKPINDTLGHEAGDYVLRHLSEKMRAALRDVDLLARVGGDEFVVLLQNRGESSREEIQRITTRLVATVSKCFAYKEHSLQLGVSIGIALFPADASNQEDLFVCADQAMYQAKHAGRNTYRFFERHAA